MSRYIFIQFTELFHLQGNQPGQTTLKLSYLRPWEKNSEPIETYELTVTVKPS